MDKEFQLPLHNPPPFTEGKEGGEGCRRPKLMYRSFKVAVVERRASSLYIEKQYAEYRTRDVE